MFVPAPAFFLYDASKTIKERNMAFCSNCGKEILEGSKFCPGCGQAVGGAPNATNTASDPAKILKQSEFRRIEKFTDTMSKIMMANLLCFITVLNGMGKLIMS